MDKKSIIGIVVVAVLFLGFAYISNKQQQQYQKDLAAYNAYNDSIKALSAPKPMANAVTDTTAVTNIAQGGEAVLPADSVAGQQQILALGDSLAAAKNAQPEVLTVENEVMKIDFSTRGGQVQGVTLKDFTKYAPKGHRDQQIELFNPESAKFDLSFSVKKGNGWVPVHTLDYVFRQLPVRQLADSAQVVTMQLSVADGAYVEYEYLIYNGQTPNRNYLVDFNVRFVNMATQMDNQTSIGIAWSNTSYQNEKGFQNENMYTTISYRIPGETSIDDLGMGDGVKEEKITTSVNWVAFKQQFFSTVFIANENFANANMSFNTAKPGSAYLKDFSAQMSVPYSPQMEAYNFAFYFGPNKYAILNKVADVKGEPLYMERLIPLGWGIFGWVNRWFVIPVFDFLRLYIGSFGLIILILSILIKIIISPLTYKSYVSMAKMRIIKPEVDELAKKFPKQEDAVKKQQATMALYKKAGVNPMGGCIPMLIQMPIIIAMFRFFPASIELREQPFLWADDLSSYDSVLSLPFNIPFYGDHVSLFAILMAIALFAFSYINYQQTASSQPQMAGMKFMMVYMMPVMMLFWFNSYSSGLCYYYFLANVITIAQTLIIRQMIDDGKLHAIMQANAAKSQNRKKSKFQQRYEALLQQQEQSKNSKK
ncbi:MAG: membrane protein insertase YidC [Alistipes sp.]